MGTLYRHFAAKQALLVAIIGRRFSAMTDLALTAEQAAEPGASFEILLGSYLEAAEQDAAFRYAVLGPEKTNWAEIAEQTAQFADIAGRIIRRAVDAGHVRGDLSFEDFVLITRGAMANMNPDDDDWRRHVTLMFEGIHAPGQ